MFEKIIQMTIVAFINAMTEKVIKPLLQASADKIAAMKKKKENKKKAKEHKDAKDKDSHQSTFNKLP